MKSQILSLAIFILLVSSYGGGQTTIPLEPTSISIPVAKPPNTSTAEPTAGSISFVDNGQRLGSGRSWDLSLGDLDGDANTDPQALASLT